MLSTIFCIFQSLLKCSSYRHLSSEHSSLGITES